MAGRRGSSQFQSQVGGSHAPATTHALYAPCVTSVFSSSKAESETVCIGFSSSAQSLSTAALQPIVKSPAGIGSSSLGSARVLQSLAPEPAAPALLLDL